MSELLTRVYDRTRLAGTPKLEPLRFFLGCVSSMNPPHLPSLICLRG